MLCIQLFMGVFLETQICKHNIFDNLIRMLELALKKILTCNTVLKRHQEIHFKSKFTFLLKNIINKLPNLQIKSTTIFARDSACFKTYIIGDPIFLSKFIRSMACFRHCKIAICSALAEPTLSPQKNSMKIIVMTFYKYDRDLTKINWL